LLLRQRGSGARLLLVARAVADEVAEEGCPRLRGIGFGRDRDGSAALVARPDVSAERVRGEAPDHGAHDARAVLRLEPPPDELIDGLAGARIAVRERPVARDALPAEPVTARYAVVRPGCDLASGRRPRSAG